jgi:hypothetical protein
MFPRLTRVAVRSAIIPRGSHVSHSRCPVALINPPSRTTRRPFAVLLPLLSLFSLRCRHSEPCLVTAHQTRPISGPYSTASYAAFAGGTDELLNEEYLRVACLTGLSLNVMWLRVSVVQDENRRSESESTGRQTSPQAHSFNVIIKTLTTTSPFPGYLSLYLLRKPIRSCSSVVSAAS